MELMLLINVCSSSKNSSKIIERNQSAEDHVVSMAQRPGRGLSRSPPASSLKRCVVPFNFLFSSSTLHLFADMLLPNLRVI